jgi:site-specific DNA-methyltransferase (adenine-specific)
MSTHIIVRDCLEALRKLPDESVHCVVTSPPYWGLRDYGISGQLGLESSFQDYLATMVEVFREVRRVLRKDGTLWLNMGDTYASAWVCNRRNVVGNGSLENGKRANRPNRLGDGLKEKDLVGMPWRLAFALQADGWYLRSDIIWHKPNPMPESVTDRPTKAHEYVFLMSKIERYFYDAEAVREDGVEPNRKRNDRIGGANGHTVRHSLGGMIGASAKRNKRTVWTIPTAPFPEAHFATFPPALVEPCILAGCPKGGIVLDPFGGAGTTALIAARLGREAILIELNPQYAAMAERRLQADNNSVHMY